MMRRSTRCRCKGRSHPARLAAGRAERESLGPMRRHLRRRATTRTRRLRARKEPASSPQPRPAFAPPPLATAAGAALAGRALATVAAVAARASLVGEWRHNVRPEPQAAARLTACRRAGRAARVLAAYRGAQPTRRRRGRGLRAHHAAPRALAPHRDARRRVACPVVGQRRVRSAGDGEEWAGKKERKKGRKKSRDEEEEEEEGTEAEAQQGVVGGGAAPEEAEAAPEEEAEGSPKGSRTRTPAYARTATPPSRRPPRRSTSGCRRPSPPPAPPSGADDGELGGAEGKSAEIAPAPPSGASTGRR